MAREARYDRFAHNDNVRVEEVRDVVIGGKHVNKDVKPVVREKSEGVKNIRVGKAVVEEVGEGEKRKIVGKEAVRVVGKGRHVKMRRVEGGTSGVKGGLMVKGSGKDVKLGNKIGGGSVVERVEEGSHMVKPVMAAVTQAVQMQPVTKFIPVYKSNDEDLKWAKSGMVASIIAGDSALALQQRVDEAGFGHVTVTPMGGDKVFIHCTGEEDIWQIFIDAIAFFSMLFTNVDKWSAKDIPYERGAWLRVYGVAIHVWNDYFFKLCVSGVGRFMHVDKCTVDKARLDFARVLVTTPQIEIIKMATEFFYRWQQVLC